MSMKLTTVLAIAISLSASAVSLGEDKWIQHYVLPATPENVQWGWYDVTERP